jgi:GNAT superfamily N-acetyltransferase
MTTYQWRGSFTNTELNSLHAEAFKTRLFSDDEWDWKALVARHSLGWVVARDGDRLVGFVNVIWDGFTHAWLQDVMVASSAGRRGIGRQLVGATRDAARAAGCEFLHVDFEADLRGFYIEACGFEPAQAGLLRL